VGIHPVSATDIPIAVEHLEIFAVPRAALAGDVGAAEDQGWMGHSSPGSSLRRWAVCTKTQQKLSRIEPTNPRK
jgi:hypothetical protein